MAAEQRIESLRRILLLADLPPWQLEVVAEALEPVQVRKGDAIVERGSDDGYTYFLSEGAVELESMDGERREVEITPEAGRTPVANLRPRIFTVRAASKVQGMRIPDVVLSAAGCTGQVHDPRQIRVESEEEEARRQAESKLSFHLYRDLKSDVAVLPSLPDLAFKIRKAIDDDISDAKAIARLVEADPAMVAKLLKAANSAFYGSQARIETTSAAVVRLGMKVTRQLVLSFALNEVFDTKNPMIRQRMQGLWRHSAQVAALCFVLARRVRGIDPEEALLIGLVHDVGAIPILNYAAKYPELTEEPEELELTISRMRGELGAMILRKWNFSPVIVAGARDAENWTRRHHGAADFTDLLIVAQVHERMRKNQMQGMPSLAEISAISRVLGDDASPEESIAILAEAKAQVDEMRSVLNA